jgi:hypothetical protein
VNGRRKHGGIEAVKDQPVQDLENNVHGDEMRLDGSLQSSQSVSQLTDGDGVCF